MSDRFNRVERMISEISTSTTSEINRFISSADTQFRSYQKSVTELQSTIQTLTNDLSNMENFIRDNAKWAHWVRLASGDVVPSVYASDVLQEVDQKTK